MLRGSKVAILGIVSQRNVKKEEGMECPGHQELKTKLPEEHGPQDIHRGRSKVSEWK